jgi:hypothetical protein
MIIKEKIEEDDKWEEKNTWIKYIDRAWKKRNKSFPLLKSFENPFASMKITGLPPYFKSFVELSPFL